MRHMCVCVCEDVLEWSYVYVVCMCACRVPELMLEIFPIIYFIIWCKVCQSNPGFSNWLVSSTHFEIPVSPSDSGISGSPPRLPGTSILLYSNCFKHEQNSCLIVVFFFSCVEMWYVHVCMSFKKRKGKVDEEGGELCAVQVSAN